MAQMPGMRNTTFVSKVVRMSDCGRRYASREFIKEVFVAYDNATDAERSEYARYSLKQRRLGKRPMIFYDWRREKETT